MNEKAYYLIKNNLRIFTDDIFDSDLNPKLKREDRLNIMLSLKNSYSYYFTLINREILRYNIIEDVYRKIVKNIKPLENIDNIFDTDLYFDLYVHFIVLSAFLEEYLLEDEEYEIINNLKIFRDMLSDYFIDNFILTQPPKQLI